MFSLKHCLKGFLVQNCIITLAIVLLERQILSWLDLKKLMLKNVGLYLKFLVASP